MKKLTVRSIVAPLRLLLLFLLLCTLPMTLAAASATQEIQRFTLASSGASTSDSFILMGSVGQPSVGLSSSASFSLNGGFWSPAEESSAMSSGAIYLPYLSR
jgi:hypothetical protein